MSDTFPISEYTCKKSEAVTYTLRGYSPGFGSWWANITIREWRGGGSLDVQSDLGGYAYSWNNIGNECLREFLCELDLDYFMEKTRGGKRAWQDFDENATAAEILRVLLEYRRVNPDILSKEKAREFWLDVKAAQESTNQESEFMHELYNHSGVFGMLYDWDMYDVPMCFKPKSDCRNFWEYLWPCACEVWRRARGIPKNSDSRVSPVIDKPGCVSKTAESETQGNK